jgi:hypothetical protein
MNLDPGGNSTGIQVHPHFLAPLRVHARRLLVLDFPIIPTMSGGPLFLTTLLIEGVTKANYNPWRHPGNLLEPIQNVERSNLK